MKRSNFIKSMFFLPFIRVPKVGQITERRIWREEDIKGGLYISRCSGSTLGHLTTVTFQIGYSFAMATNMKTNNMYVVSSVADGWSHGMVPYSLDQRHTCGGYTKADLVAYLNGDHWGYRPTTMEEMHDIIDHCRKNFINEPISKGELHPPLGKTI